ncbi:MAG TPA: hypothetical protein VHC19_06530 [Pirellulales bacterium]|nr:hypothetical protein [Pirellulales bacterium]
MPPHFVTPAATFVTLASLLLAATMEFHPALGAGPETGKQVPPLKVFDATGLHAGGDADYAAERKGRPTIYIFVQASRWDRPTARFLRAVDETLGNEAPEAYIVAVWLTDDVEKTRRYLPIAQQSLQLSRTALTCYTANKDGPKDWQLDLAAAVSVVVAAQGKVAETLDYRSVNETLAPEVAAALKKAL